MSVEILMVSGGRTPLVDKGVERRSSANGPVVEYKMSPEELQQLREKDAPKVKFWEPTLTRDEYLQLRIEGKKIKDIVLAHFNNEDEKWSKQLREWGFRDQKKEKEAMARKQLNDLGRNGYLARRAAGETRTKIMRDLGVNSNLFYNWLDGWGLKDRTIEEQILAEMVPVDERSAETHAEASDPEKADDSESNAETKQECAEPMEEAESALEEPVESAGAEILQRVEQRAADREREIADLQAAAAHWREAAEREKRLREQDNEVAKRIIEAEVGLTRQKDVEIVRLEGIVSELTESCDKAIAEADGLRADVAKWKGMAKRYEQQVLPLSELVTELTDARDRNAAEAEEMATGILERDQRISKLLGRVKELEQAERDLCVLQKAHDDVRRDTELASARIERLEADNEQLVTEARIANDVVEGLRNRVRKLEHERELNERHVFLRLPVLPGTHPIQQRIDTVKTVERFALEIESSSMDRGRAAMELFQLVQTFVGLIYSELADLHPGGRDVVGYVKSFFGYHNQQHLVALADREQVG